jgi:ATP/maltotriose-dependent transcriptional regulator MalT
MGEGIVTDPQVGRRRIVPRPRLLKSLNDSAARIKILFAPAGYGKTTLAQQWLANAPSGWCVCSQAYVDVAALASGLQSAAAFVVPGSGAALLERLPVTRRADEEVDVLAGMLAEDLVSWPPGGWLVIDDYHAIAGARAAERFVEALLLQTSINLLVLTRRRPAWASSRRILYGEVFELDRTSLAMTDDEARGVLTNSSSDVEALIGLAQGWPAVLALASTSGVAPPDLVTAPHLYTFFAEELYRQIDRRTRRALCELALYDVTGRRLALSGLRPEEAERVIRVAVDRGFITVSRDASLEMHPLLRSFLEQKLREESRGKLHELLGRVATMLMRNELWDAAFSVIDRFGEIDLMSELIESSLEPMLRSGRSATLRNWMKSAQQTAPPVRLAAAELAFREGRFHESEALASLVAREADEEDELGARANTVAGRAAHAASREDEALRCYQRARESTDNPELRRVAMYGELAAAIELELEEHAIGLLRSLGPSQSLEPHDRVIFTDRKMNLESHFGISSGFEDGRAARQLLGFVADPVARSSFRNVLGYALAVGGYYTEALDITQEQLDEADRFRLDFVVPYALIVRALASGGLHDYSTADDSLSEADERANFVGDPTALHITQAVRTRLFTAQGAFEHAVSKPLPSADDLPRAIFAELCSAYAVALAGHGHTERARHLADIGEHHSMSADARIGAACARAIVALRNSAYDEGCREAQLALGRATRANSIEPFVTAYRGCPEILVSLLTEPESHSDVARVLTLAGDATLMSRQALPDHSVLSLSRREKEVLALVARGLSNAQIGAALYISPVTVKVHVRHIFEKLGVKSRAEAAMRASQLPR